MKAGIMDSESLMWFVFVCEINFENYFPLTFSEHSAFLKQDNEINYTPTHRGEIKFDRDT